MKNKTGVIHQLLHGYDNGHSLLNGSIELSTEAKRNILIMSDMSGPTLEPGFEEYITGYPIVDSNVYAIAKTWYAPEMDRPGCVWTHTLLVNFSDLSKISNAHTIIRLFRRPDRFLRTDEYERDIQIESFDTRYVHIGLTGVDDFSESFVRTLLHNLYSMSTPVLLKAQASEKIDNLIVSIRLQQWPRLRRSFSFCSGAITPRYLGKEPLDLQVVPYHFNSKRALTEFNVLEQSGSEAEVVVPHEEWIMTAYHDLKYPSLLRDFLKDFGSDISPMRKSFAILTKLYLHLVSNEKQDIHSIIKLLAESFESPGEAMSLKSGILNRQPGRRAYLPLFSEEEVLYGLSSTEYAPSFDYKKLEVKERLADLYNERPTAVLNMLNNIITSQINKYGEDAIRYVVEKMSVSDLSHMSANHKNLLFVFITLNPPLS